MPGVRPGSGGGGYGPGPRLGAVSRQNKAAKTYISKTPRSVKQQEASAAAGKRTKAAFKAKKREPLVAAGAAMGGAILGGGTKKKPYGPPANKSVQSMAKKKAKGKK